MDRIEIERFISFPESLELSEILKLYITLLNSTYNGIIATDRNANIIFVNKAAEEMIGVKYNEVLGVPLRAVVPEADVRGVIESGKKQTGQKVRLPNNRFVITNRSPIFFNGDTIGMVGVFQDISDIEAISNELESVKQMNRLLQKIIDSIYDGLAIADGKGYILSINSAFERIANVTPAEFVGKHANQLTQEGFVSKSVTMQVLETRKPANLSIKVKAGKDLFHSAVPIFDENGEIIRVVTVMRDLTELNDLRRKLEEAVAEKSLYFDELKRMKDRNGGKDIVCFSSGMKNVMQVAEKVAQFDTTILITGDSGSGKEVLARYIHNKSPRKNEPFIKVNCGAIPENLLESELFGYDGGAFTGAVKSGKKGLLDEADNGSFLLDEISELPLNLQVKLLRLLQEREFYRVGGNAPIRLNIRFIATSNKDLYALVKENKFRADLYYRLNVVQIQIPPLTERREEIPALVKLFLNKLNSKYHQNKQITNYAIDLLSSYDWPGNIRELENTIERLAITCPDDLITHTHLLPSKVKGISLDPVAEHNLPGDKGGLKRALDQLEKGMILRAYEQTGCTRKAGILLGINQSTVVKKMKKHELSINYKRNSS